MPWSDRLIALGLLLSAAAFTWWVLWFMGRPRHEETQSDLSFECSGAMPWHDRCTGCACECHVREVPR